MKKDFLTITPESGGTASVSAVADPNFLAKERSRLSDKTSEDFNRQSEQIYNTP